MKNEPLHPSSEELFAYRDGETVPEKRAIIEAHVMGCSLCRSFIDQISSLEAELRQSADRAPAGYLEGLHESVRARIAAAASGAPDAGRAERWSAPERRSEEKSAARERGRVKEAPGLPWAAVISTASAAAAVMVVVVILIKQGPYQRMITPQSQVMARRAPASGGPAKQESREEERDKSDADLRANTGVKAKKEQAGAERGRVDLQGAPGAPAPTDEAARDLLQKRADEGLTKTEPAPARVGESAPLGAAQSRPAEPESYRKMEQKPLAAPGALKDEIAPTPGFEAILTRYGLPPVWDGTQVSAGALANAEPDLRSFYMSGGAGSDSGRVRLYLAEAARLRYAPGDSVLYDEILRHYRRAIVLGGPYSRIARVAEERLRTLER
jgi:hypothetical protein